MKKSTRLAYGDALKDLMQVNKDIVVLDADLGSSTKSMEVKKVASERYFDMGIAEGNMVAVAAGMATCGKIPFISSFAMFLAGRAFEQIRNAICYPSLNVKICATHSGISVGEDGASHQCLEDINLMRTLPNMNVIVPCDYFEAKQALYYVSQHKGAFYVRLGRNDVDQINDSEYCFQFGKGITLRQGDPESSVVLIATGNTVHECLKAYDLLESKPKIINIHTIKPIDRQLIQSLSQTYDYIFTVEDHFINGGLGTSVAEVMAESNGHAKLIRMGIKDRFGESGNAEELYKKYEIDSISIVNKILEITKKGDNE